MCPAIPLRIGYQDGRFVLHPGSLSLEEKGYLQGYLDRVNRYQVIGWHAGSPVFSLYQPALATEAGMRSLDMRLRRRFENTRIPATATVSVTKACQCECEHCSAVFYNHSSQNMLTTPQLTEALRQSVDCGVTTLILLGGEPLLRPDLFDIIQGVPKDRATVILFSNGEYLTAQNCQRLKGAGLMGAFISLDAAEAAAHDHLRKRPGLFVRILKGIENMQRAGLLVGISSYLSPQRLINRVFEDMMELGKELGVHEVTFFDAIPSGRWLRDTRYLLQPSDRLKIKALVKLFRSQRNYPGISAQSTMTSFCGSSFCFAANTQFYLTACGEMCPCDFTPLTIGSFPQESIANLWSKMTHTPPYHERAKSCRMQDALFRAQWIDPIPAAGPFPYSLDRRVDVSP